MDRNIAKASAKLVKKWSLSARRAWIEIFSLNINGPLKAGSLSARRAWIEIRSRCPIAATGAQVALRKESVDRNSKASSAVRLGSVALRKESVDRNQGAAADRAAQQTSLSARRAWIEIFLNRCAARPTKVALRKESRECFSF